MAAGYASAVDIRDAIRRGELTAEAACAGAIDRVRATDPALGAFLHVAADRALARARALDRDGDRGAPLHGVPVALKDNLCLRGMPATAGSRLLAPYEPPYDATAAARLEAAGAVVIGKTACDEFAMGSSTENCAFGPTRNPWAPDRIPGGSSGGSAAAVAAGMVPLALGSDTGGSVRQPAALCGVVGVKPTYGRVSRYGLIAFASSLDQIGPIARTVTDAALGLEAISGPDPRDATAHDAPVPSFSGALSGRIAGARIGVPRHLLREGVDEDVLAAFDASLGTLASLGAEIVEIELPHSRYAIPVYYLIAPAEASSNLARYDGVRYGVRAAGAADLGGMYRASRSAGLGPEVKRRIMLGTYVLSAGYYDAYYLKAQQVRTLIRRDHERALDEVTAIATPTSPTPAFPLGERIDDPVQMYLTDVFTVGAPLAGLPALSVPCGFTSAGLPAGLQLVGRAWDEVTLLNLAYAYEQATDWLERRPPIAS